MPIIQAYHGTNQQFDKFDQEKSRVVNDHFGGGVAYFTVNLPVAKQYAKAAVRKSGGSEIIYRVQLNLRKTFDVDAEYTGKELKDLMTTNFEQFARSAGLLNLGVDKYGIMADLKSGNKVMTGDQIFRGLSNGMINTNKAREHLKKRKFDSLRYNGGMNMSMAIKHDVYIAYDARAIRITAIYGKDDNE